MYLPHLLHRIRLQARLICTKTFSQDSNAVFMTKEPSFLVNELQVFVNICNTLNISQDDLWVETSFPNTSVLDLYYMFVDDKRMNPFNHFLRRVTYNAELDIESIKKSRSEDDKAILYVCLNYYFGY